MAKVRGTRQALKSIEKQIAKTATKSLLRNSDSITREIQNTILSGQSPVAGKKFPNYSPAYAKKFKKGKLKPVDLFRSGEMLASLVITKLGRGISIVFASETAVFHDKLGAGISKVIRRLLPVPSKGETFKRNILRAIRRAAQKGFK